MGESRGVQRGRCHTQRGLDNITATHNVKSIIELPVGCHAQRTRLPHITYEESWVVLRGAFRQIVRDLVPWIFMTISGGIQGCSERALPYTTWIR